MLRCTRRRRDNDYPRELGLRRISFVSICYRRLYGVVEGNIGSSSCREPLGKLGVIISTNGKINKFCTRGMLSPLKTSAANDHCLRPSNVFPGRVPGPRGRATVGSIQRTALNTGTSLNMVFSASISHNNYMDSSNERVGEGTLITLTTIVTLRDGPNNAIIASSMASTKLARFVRGALNKRRLHFGHNCGGIVSRTVELRRGNVGTPLTVRASNRTTFERGCCLSSNTCLVAGVVVGTTSVGGRNGGLCSLVSRLGCPTRRGRVHLGVDRRSFETINSELLRRLTSFTTGHRS